MWLGESTHIEGESLVWTDTDLLLISLVCVCVCENLNTKQTKLFGYLQTCCMSNSACFRLENK